MSGTKPTKITRRELLRRVGIVGAGLAAVAAGCGGEPEVIEKIVKETVVVEKEKIVEVEKEVTRVVEIEAKKPEGPKLAEEQVLRLQQDREPTQGLDPSWAGGWGRMRTLLTSLYSGLLWREPDGTVEPDIATRWESNGGNTVWTFYLRKDVKFNDGSPLTAHDVKYTLTRSLKQMSADEMLDAGVVRPISPMAEHVLGFLKGGYAYSQKQIDSLPDDTLVVLDDYTIQMTLEQPRADWDVLLSNPGNGIIKKEVVETSKQGAVWYENPVGTGPFMLDSWKHDEELVLVPNPHYYGTKPTLQKIIMPIIADPQTCFILYQNDEIDVFKPELVDVAEMMKPGSQYRDQLQTQNEFMTAILKGYYHPPITDVHVRRALAMSIDRDLICSSILNNVVAPTPTYTQPTHKGYNMQGVDLLLFNPQRAREELAKSEWGDDPSKMPKIRLSVPGGLSGAGTIAIGTWPRIAAAIQQMWQDYLGITVTIKVTPHSQHTPETIQHWFFSRQGATYPSPIAMIEKWWQDWQQRNDAETQDSAKTYGVCPFDPEVEKIVREYWVNPSWDLVRKAEQYLADLAPYIPLYTNRTYWMVQPKVQNLTIGSDWGIHKLNETYIVKT